MANTDGLAAAVITRVHADGSVASEVVSATPIHLGNPGEEVYLSLYGTGIRGNSSLSAVTVHLGDKASPALYAGPQPQFIGLDQVNVKLTNDLVGSGRVQVSVDAGGAASNSVSVVFEQRTPEVPVRLCGRGFAAPRLAPTISGSYRGPTGGGMVSLLNRGTISSRLATCHPAAATIAAAFCTSSGIMRS